MLLSFDDSMRNFEAALDTAVAEFCGKYPGLHLQVEKYTYHRPYSFTISSPIRFRDFQEIYKAVMPLKTVVFISQLNPDEALVHLKNYLEDLRDDQRRQLMDFIGQEYDYAAKRSI